MYCSWCVTSSNFPAALHSFFCFLAQTATAFSHKIRAKQSSVLYKLKPGVLCVQSRQGDLGITSAY